MTYQFIDHNNQKLLVKRIFREYQLKPDFDVNVLRAWVGADLVLRKDGLFYCCEVIQDAIVIEQ